MICHIPRLPKHIRIWVDAEDGCETHIYISLDGSKALHYYHWDSLLLWHDTDIIHAERVDVVQG